MTDVCRKHGIRLIPLMNCLGHQSWGAKPGALLEKYPQFDETPSIPQDDKKIYCREWCPSHPDVNKIVFDLLDELIDAFDADAMHVGMDEVFLIGDKNCPRCKGKDVGELFAKVVNELHEHLVDRQRRGDADVERPAAGRQGDEVRELGGQRHRLAPGDRPGAEGHHHVRLALRDCPRSISRWARKQPFPSVQFFQEKGFRVLPATWRNPEAAVALLRVANRGDRQDARHPLHRLGAGTSPDGLLAGLKSEPKPFKLGKEPSPEETTQGIAATIQAGLKELKAPAERRFSHSGIPEIRLRTSISPRQRQSLCSRPTERAGGRDP